MAFVNNFSQACGVRFLLGVFEAGMMPGIAYYLSRWYRRSELTLRLSLYIVMSPLAGAFGGLLASAILKLDHFGSLHGWRMIFGIEGIITVGLALIGFLTLTDHPATARWLTQEEKDLAIARVKSERVGQTEIIDKMDAKKLKRGIFNPVVFFTGLAFLLNNITVQGLAFFAPTVVATIYPTKSIIQKQLLTVPPYIVGGFFTILMPLISRWFDRRQILIIACCPLVMVGYIMFLATENAHIRYGAAFLVSTSVFAAGPLTNSQVSANVVSDTARSSALGYNGKLPHDTHVPPPSLSSSYNGKLTVLLPYFSHGGQHWWSRRHLEFPPLRRPQLPHRQRHQPCCVRRHPRHLSLPVYLDEEG